MKDDEKQGKPYALHKQQITSHLSKSYAKVKKESIV